MAIESSAVLAADAARQANLDKDRGERAELGQFLTPTPIAGLMAGMFGRLTGRVRLLDPGAGSGALTAAFVAEMTQREVRPARIEATCVEIDPEQRSRLGETLARCAELAAGAGIGFAARIVADDFVSAGAVTAKLAFGERYDAVIMNPPYRKIGTTSPERGALRSIGVETVNLYTAFMALAAHLLEDGGSFVSITPRSFCNGPYYRPFRQDFLARMSLRRIHVFATRDAAFADDAVLQENVIVAAVRARQDPAEPVTISESLDAGVVRSWSTRRSSVVKPGDPERFIHIHPGRDAEAVSSLFDGMRLRLADLGLSVSTGPVVDFRHRVDLAAEPGADRVPLYWPRNCRDGRTTHPVESRKPQWIRVSGTSAQWLSPNARFVLVKRFSAKEEKRRLVAVVHDPASVAHARIGLENHLNFIHRGGAGLPADLAAGIACYLNSGLLDAYFRQFNGHTQVNATDLRRLPFPSADQLAALGREASDATDPAPGDALIRSLASA